MHHKLLCAFAIAVLFVASLPACNSNSGKDNKTSTQPPPQPTSPPPLTAQTPTDDPPKINQPPQVQPENPIWNDALIKTLPAQGSDAAPYKLLVFLDIESPEDRTFLRELDSLRQNLSADRLQVRVGLYPMNTLCNSHISKNRTPSACTSARALLCAHDQGHFWLLLDEIRAFFNNNASAEATLFAESDAIGLLASSTQGRADLDRLRTCMADAETNARLAAITERASALGIGGTPSFVVNGQLPPFPPLAPFSKIQQWVELLPPVIPATAPNPNPNPEPPPNTNP